LHKEHDITRENNKTFHEVTPPNRDHKYVDNLR
jgi:hypothetical protein